MSIYSPNQELYEDTNDIYLINPSVEEFKTSFLDDKNQTVHVTLAPLEERKFPKAKGQVVLKHLVNFILNKSGFSYKTDVNLELSEIRKKCVIYE